MDKKKFLIKQKKLIKDMKNRIKFTDIDKEIYDNLYDEMMSRINNIYKGTNKKLDPMTKKEVVGQLKKAKPTKKELSNWNNKMPSELMILEKYFSNHVYLLTEELAQNLIGKWIVVAMDQWIDNINTLSIKDKTKILKRIKLVKQIGEDFEFYDSDLKETYFANNDNDVLCTGSGSISIHAFLK